MPETLYVVLAVVLFVATPIACLAMMPWRFEKANKKLEDARRAVLQKTPLGRSLLALHQLRDDIDDLLLVHDPVSLENGPFVSTIRSTDWNGPRIDIQKGQLLLCSIWVGIRATNTGVGWTEAAEGLPQAMKARLVAMVQEGVADLIAKTKHAIQADAASLHEAIFAHTPDLTEKAGREPGEETGHLTALASLCREARDMREDAEFAAALDRLASTCDSLVKRLQTDPASARSLDGLLDYAAPKARVMLNSYLRLAREPDLTAVESANLAAVRDTLMKLPRLFEDHLAVARGSELTALMDQRDGFEAIALTLDRPTVTNGA